MQNNQKIPEGWSVKKLGDVCTKKGQYGANAPAAPYNCSLPTYLRITDIDEDGKYSVLNRVSVNIADYRNYLLKKGDIVFARTGASTGKTYLYNEKDGDLVFAGFLIKFSPNQSLINPYYLKLLTGTPLYNHWIEIMSVRSGQPGINADEYAQYPLLLPSLPEQEKIAGILGTWDEAIEKLSSLIEQKKNLKKDLMQRLLTGKTRLKGFTQPWKEVKLGDFLRECVEKTTINNQYKVLSVTKNGVCSQEEYFDKQIASENNIGYKVLKKNNIVFSPMNLWMGSLGFSEYDIGIVSPAYKIFTVNENVALFLFLKYFMITHRMIYLYLINSEQGASIVRRNLDLAGLLSSKVYIPSLTEQKAIADVLSTADEEIDLLNKKLEALKEQKKGLMQELLTGQTRVKVN